MGLSPNMASDISEMKEFQDWNEVEGKSGYALTMRSLELHASLAFRRRTTHRESYYASLQQLL